MDASGGIAAPENSVCACAARRHSTENAHIFGIVLTYALLQCAGAAVSIIIHSLWQIADYFYNLSALLEEPLSYQPRWFVRMWNMLSEYLVLASYIKMGVLLLVTLVLLWLLNNESKRLQKIPLPQEAGCRVKKTLYIWLGFLLGGYGAHLFLLPDKRRAWIFLIMGICSIWLRPLMWYTIGVSLADAWLACRLQADAEGCIYIEKYNRIL